MNKSFIMESDFYKEFENNFRGSREQIMNILSSYDGLIDYILNIDKDPSLLDIGCGRGEWIQKCTEMGFKSLGIELNTHMVNDCRSLNLNVKEGDALSLLDGFSENSFSIISAFHVIEHMNQQDIEQLLVKCKRIIKPEGLLVLETPSIDNFLVSTKSFYIDPTHINPIHPDLLAFIAKRTGFSKLKYYFLNGGPLQDATPDTLTRFLNGVAQDLVLVASKSDLVDNKIFDNNNLIARDMKLGITSLQAAIDFDDFSRNRYAEYDKQISEMRGQINDLEHQLKFLRTSYRMTLIPIFIKIFRKCYKMLLIILTKIKKIITTKIYYFIQNKYMIMILKRLYSIKYFFFLLRFFERIVARNGFRFYLFKYVKKSKKKKEDSELVVNHDKYLNTYYNSSNDAKMILKDLKKNSKI